MGDQRLRPTERLRCPSAYQRVFRHGKKLVAPLFTLYILPNSEPSSRLGLAVSKRVGHAVIRHRIKRRLRELFRCHKALLQPACDIVVVAHREAAEAPFTAYKQQFLRLIWRCQEARQQS